jgi:hypothetical protein
MSGPTDALLTSLAARMKAEGLIGFSVFSDPEGWRVTPRSTTGWRQQVVAPTIAGALAAALAAAGPDCNARAVVRHDDPDTDDWAGLV